MKNVFKNWLALGLATTILLAGTISVYAATKNPSFAVLSSFKNFNKIVVSGNVEVTLIQDVHDQVSIMNDYYPINVLLQEKKGLLHISNYNRAKLNVVIHLKNLSSLTVKDKSTVRTVGNFYLLNFDVDLRDQAKANIKANTVNLTTHIADQAQLILTGCTDQYDAKVEETAALNLNQFRAQHTNFSNEITAYTQTYK
ncbi:GIN domain-containing protein [Pedobacter sp.]|uniref:GIN domain-containing protein n=1 Tax=Pedobacter sp. TaxID=1411316 RepID=UPI003D7FE735